MGFTTEEETRTIRCSTIHPPKVFTGTALRRGEYSMQKEYKPASGRHALTGSLARNILHQLLGDRGMEFKLEIKREFVVRVARRTK